MTAPASLLAALATPSSHFSTFLSDGKKPGSSPPIGPPASAHPAPTAPAPPPSTAPPIAIALAPLRIPSLIRLPPFDQSCGRGRYCLAATTPTSDSERPALTAPVTPRVRTEPPPRPGRPHVSEIALLN